MNTTKSKFIDSGSSSIGSSAPPIPPPQLSINSAGTPKKTSLYPKPPTSLTQSKVTISGLSKGFVPKPPMPLGSRPVVPPRPGPFKTISMPGPFRSSLFPPPGPFKPTSVPVPFKPSSCSSKQLPPRPNPFKCGGVLAPPKVTMTGPMISRPPPLSQNHKMIPPRPSITVIPPIAPRSNVVMMPPASQPVPARSMMRSRLSMGRNRIMMSGSAPSSIGQLSTNSVLKKTPKKKRGRAKRSLKEFERGKPSDSGPSPKFRRVGKTAKEDDKNNRKRKIKWNVEPHYTVMRKAVGLALDGQSTTRVAQEFGIPARTLRRYVATAKKANGLPETAATDRPTHAPSKKKKSASLKSESGFFGSLNRLDTDYESYDSDEEEDDATYGRVRSNSLDMLLAAADKSDHEGPSLLPNDSSGFAAPASAHVSWADDATPEKSSANNISFTSRPERSGSLDLFFQALGSDLRNGDKRGRSDNRGLSFDVPALVRDQIAKSVTKTPEKSRPRNNSLWSPTLTIT